MVLGVTLRGELVGGDLKTLADKEALLWEVGRDLVSVSMLDDYARQDVEKVSNYIVHRRSSRQTQQAIPNLPLSLDMTEDLWDNPFTEATFIGESFGYIEDRVRVSTQRAELRGCTLQGQAQFVNYDVTLGDVVELLNTSSVGDLSPSYSGRYLIMGKVLRGNPEYTTQLFLLQRSGRL